MTKVVGYSFDMDGCIFINDDTEDPVGIFNQHPALFDPLKKDARKKYIFCGSARQSLYHDNAVSERYKTPLAKTMIGVISKKHGAIHNTFLMSDIASILDENNNRSSDPIFHHHSPGTQNAKRLDLSRSEYACNDSHKITMIYCQISNLCLHEPDADEVEFNFYDDRLDILKMLSDFFSKRPELLPKNLTLNLYHYSHFDGVRTPALFKKIQGTCEKIHTNYYSVVEKLVQDNVIETPSEGVHKFNPDKFTKEYEKSIIEIATNGKRSHHPGEGLVYDYLKSELQELNPGSKNLLGFLYHDKMSQCSLTNAIDPSDRMDPCGLMNAVEPKNSSSVSRRIN